MHLDKTKSMQPNTKPMFRSASKNLVTFTIVLTNLAERGCTFDMEKTSELTQNTGNIKSGCKSENIIQSECVSCKSGFNGKCATISDVGIDVDTNSLKKQCTGIYSHEKRGCYTIVKNEMVHQGCIKDLGNDDYETCEKKENCELCTEDGCNVSVAGSSGRLTVNFGIIIFIISISYWFKLQ